MKKLSFLIFAFVVSTLSGCGNASNLYTVTWLNYDGTVLEIDNSVEEGTIPSYDGKTPQKSSSLGKNYVFSGWSPTIETVKSDATYFAIFNEETISYTITWDVDGKKTTEVYNYGDTPTYKGSTEKEGNAQYTYTFSGWSPEITSVTADKTYVAQYNQLVNSYTITWDVDGKKTTENYNYGDTPTYKGAIEKEGNDEFSYSFSGWSPEITSVTADKTYVAQYNQLVNSYTITWDVDGKKTTEVYNYGEIPSYKSTIEKERNDQYTYTFSGWSPSITSVTGNKTYTAQFTNTTNSYTITWDIEGVKTTEVYNYGEIPSYKNGTPTKVSTEQYSYSFAGWSPEMTLVTADKTYVAQYNQLVNSYTITWDVDGKKTTEVYNYGEIPSYKSTIEKEGNDQFSYSFSGWSPEIGTVNCDKTYVAEFSSHTREYSVSWYNGTVLLKKEFLEYGTVPSYSGTIPFKESTVDGHYVFSGWNEMLNPICSDVSFHAKFDFEPFDFSIQILEGTNVTTELIENKQYNISVLSNIANSEDAIDRKYEYSIDSSRIGSIDNAVLSTKESGYAIITVKEVNSNLEKKTSIDVLAPSIKANGEYRFTKNSDKTEILGKLEKYAFDSHLSGIPISDNGGYVRYSDRVELPTNEYIEGYGFGLLAEGRLNGTLTGDEGKKHPTYLHESISQDSLKINQYIATGSQVSDLASYITSTYWGTRLKDNNKEYEWYPLLATDEIYPTNFKDGNVVIDVSKNKVVNSMPIPMEEKNEFDMYRKWRIYVKTDGVNGASLKFTTASEALKAKGFNRGVTIDDYEFAYKILLTGSNNIIRGTEMANDTFYGIKGAQCYFNETKNAKTKEEINKKWKEFVDNDKLGINKGYDDTNNSDYLDIELINPIDEFTAMYKLSSSLVSPLPEEMFLGDKAIAPTMKEAIQLYGTFGKGGGDDEILDYTICLGAFTLTKWTKNQEIVYARNDDWFEHKNDARYHIPGVDLRVIDTSIDTEKGWKKFECGDLDLTNVPPRKLADYRNNDKVFIVKGDSIFKLNINSLTQEQWDEKFGTNGTISQGSKWNVKPWMSNSNFLDGLFYSIDRKSFASKRGTSPSINFFSDSYMSDPQFGISYNSTEDHKNAIKKYETIFNGVSNFGFDLEKSRLCFKNAIEELSNEGKLIIGTKENPTEISIHIRWMYLTDIREYGDDIKYYFETAFNDPSVCGGRVKLRVDQDAVTNWEDVYECMMKGQFDLAFGNLEADFYNPLSFMETLKSNNSSGFTLDWGEDTSLVSEKNPICYNHERWSFDALYQAAFTGCTVQDGMLIA